MNKKSQMKICVVIGTRPEVIKMAPVILALLTRPQSFSVTVCSTGQHTTMLDSAMNVFGLKPDFELGIMRPGQSLAELTSRLLLKLDDYFQTTHPDLILVHGDTTSAMTASLAAFYRQIEIGHIEAGLRTGNLLSPYPEEYNRRLVSIGTHHHFAPTLSSKANLISEGIASENILVTGNTVIDALLLTIKNLESNPQELSKIQKHLHQILGFNIDENPFVLITAHRRENFGRGLDNICFSIKKLAHSNPGLHFVYPVHLNPKVKDMVEYKLGNLDNVSLVPPQDYKYFAWLLRQCQLILTDSGGIQEEAPSLGKPVLVMRDTSERPEAIEAGTAKLVTTDPEIIIRETQTLINDRAAYQSMAVADNPFGDGLAADRIVNYLLNL